MAMRPSKKVNQGHKAEKYRFNVSWSDADGVFIGRVTEFPSLAAHGSSQEKALREIRSVVQYVLEDHAADAS
jgi:predicted RNase H-like HicB family nuclease